MSEVTAESKVVVTHYSCVLGCGAFVPERLMACAECERKGAIESKEFDPVDRPAHYAAGEIEVIDAIEDWGLGFHLGNVVKYVARAGKKDPDKLVQDLEKAAWYLARKIKILKAPIAVLFALFLGGCAQAVLGVVYAGSIGLGVYAGVAEAKSAAARALDAASKPVEQKAEPEAPRCSQRACFSPGRCDEFVRAELDAATSTIDAAVYSLSSPTLVGALVAAAKRGVRVRVATDRTQSAGKAAAKAVAILRAAGVGIVRNTHAGFMHEKATIVDGAVLVAGSFNWTTRATELNDEDAMVLCDPSLVAAHFQKFESMWHAPDRFEVVP